jgi:hypothetical protein
MPLPLLTARRQERALALPPTDDFSVDSSACLPHERRHSTRANAITGRPHARKRPLGRALVSEIAPRSGAKEPVDSPSWSASRRSSTEPLGENGKARARWRLFASHAVPCAARCQDASRERGALPTILRYPTQARCRLTDGARRTTTGRDVTWIGDNTSLVGAPEHTALYAYAIVRLPCCPVIRCENRHRISARRAGRGHPRQADTPVPKSGKFRHGARRTSRAASSQALRTRHARRAEPQRLAWLLVK